MSRRICFGPSRGSASIELTILTLPVIAFFAAMVMAGRITLAHQAADAAAYDAARTASLAPNAAAAQEDGEAAALASFASQGITCVSLEVEVDPSGFTIPPGEPVIATVSASVECDAELADIALPGLNMPGHVTLSSSFISPLDRYRSRS